MIRQRVRLRGCGASEIFLRLLVSLLALALIFYGAMVVLAACKLAPDTINAISRYRTIDRALGSITAADITGRDRVTVAVAGVICLVLFAPLTWRALPRAYRTRRDVDLVDASGPGTTEIRPRALERAAELAARTDPRVSTARARYGSGAIDLRVHLAEDGGDTTLLSWLRAIQQRTRRTLAEHGLPSVAVDVTLAGAPARRIPKENPS